MIQKTIGITKDDYSYSGDSKEFPLLILPQNKDDVGCILMASFSSEKRLDDEPHHLGINYYLVAEIQKTKHAFVIGDINNQNLETFLEINEIFDLKPVKNKNIDTLYQLANEFDPEGDDRLNEVVEKIGIDTVMTWFENGDFLPTFNGLHEYLGNKPEDFIFQK